MSTGALQQAADLLSGYEKMAQNNAWANATLYRAAQDLPQEAGQASAPGFFPTLCRTLNHIYEVDLYYIDALEAEIDERLYLRQRRGYELTDTGREFLQIAQRSYDLLEVFFGWVRV